MSILSVLGTMTGVLPLIQTIIAGVESLFGSGNGASKLTAAQSATMATLQAYALLQKQTLPPTMEADLTVAINANVKVMNDLGLLLPHAPTVV